MKNYGIKTIFHLYLAVAMLPIVTAAIGGDSGEPIAERTVSTDEERRAIARLERAKILRTAEAEFNAATSQEAKFAIVCRHVGSIEKINGMEYAENNLLSLAIRAGYLIQ